ncbi:MAG: hypothetical protein LBL24_06935 [Bacteroidales bacterium]|jgi:hypothetical protein|nr:hypothetical protein [Bacteroidales bacterium]
MKKVEPILGCLFILARIFQILHIPSYAVLQVMVLTGFFFMSILYPVYKIRSLNVFVFICVGYSITAYATGVVLIALYYRIGWHIFYGGLAFSIFSLFILWRNRKNIPDDLYKENVIRIGVVLGIGVLSVILPP